MVVSGFGADGSAWNASALLVGLLVAAEDEEDCVVLDADGAETAGAVPPIPIHPLYVVIFWAIRNELSKSTALSRFRAGLGQ